jgi:hypothetical protein
MSAFESGATCAAFWLGLLTVGNELVVYASRRFMGGQEYSPLRGKTTLVSRAKDIGALGRGHKPK